MDINRCKEIVRYNIAHSSRIQEALQTFYAKCGLQYAEQLRFDSWEYVKMVAQKMSVVSIFFPMSDEELGAFLYYTPELSYMFVNSSIPQVNMQFAYCHELYHALYPEKTLLSHGLEMYLDYEYSEDEEERLANAFAGNVLMPEETFINYYDKLKGNEQLSKKEIIAKLSEAFGAPYMATVIRVFELRLLEGMEELTEVFITNKDEIAELYEKCWLNVDLLKPTGRNQYMSLEHLLSEKGEKLINEDLLTRQDFDRIMNKVRKTYQEISRKGK